MLKLASRIFLVLLPFSLFADSIAILTCEDEVLQKKVSVSGNQLWIDNECSSEKVDNRLVYEMQDDSFLTVCKLTELKLLKEDGGLAPFSYTLDQIAQGIPVILPSARALKLVVHRCCQSVGENACVYSRESVVDVLP